LLCIRFSRKFTIHRDVPVLTALTVGLTGLTSYSFEVEPVSVKVERIQVRYPGRKGVPHGLRIIQLTDIHRSSLVHDSYIKKCILRAVGLKPAIILLTGDYVTCSKGFDEVFTGFLSL